MRKLLILFAENGEVTMDEIIEWLYEDDPEGGPLYAEGTVRVMLSRLRDKLSGRVEITRRSTYRLDIPGVKRRDET